MVLNLNYIGGIES